LNVNTMKQQAESPVIILFSIFAFIILFLFYLFSLNPILPTGDAGELITASYLLGIAHPPGYPLYTELGKLFTFLPFGNIGYRVSLIPCFFSILTLILIYLITRILTIKNSIFPLIAVLFLGVSYSFYFQTIIGKFYPVNALIVLLLVLIGIKVIDSGFEKRYAYLSAFLLGILTGLHHTALLMTVPLFIVGLFYFKAFIRSLPLSLLFFFLGFLINLHIYIRNIKDAFLAIRKAKETPYFIDILLRKFYKEGESLQVVTSTLSTFEGFQNAITNFLYMIDANFGYVTMVFFVMGFFYLYRKSRRILLFLSISFLMFSLVLAKITFAGEIKDNEGSLYIVGNQYFIPAFCLYVIFMTAGIYFFVEKIKKLIFLYKTIPLFFIVLPLIFIPMRFSQTGQSNNWVLYYYSKGLLSTLPVSSVLTTYGDNKSFGVWYIKLVGRYRDDVCHLVVFRYEATKWNMEGCKPEVLYKDFYSEFYRNDIQTLVNKKLYYSTIGLSEIHPYFKSFDTIAYGLVYVYFPKSKITEKDRKFVNELNIKAEKFITPYYCLNHGTDDPLTFSVCRFVSIAYLNIASSIEPNLKFGTFALDTTIRYGNTHEPFRVNINIGKENEHYMELYEKIRKYNAREKAFLFP